MQNLLFLTSLALIWLFYLSFVDAEYRFKLRGPQPPPRGPNPAPSHQIKKKWHMPHMQQQMQMQNPRLTVRKRPMVHVHNNNLNYKLNNLKPVGPLLQKRPILAPMKQTIIPMRNVWNGGNNFKKPEKLFVSSPTVKTPEYEYHIRTNNIPNPSISHASSPVKVNDYKGPIHTIPAPKLSPADKPKNIETVRPESHVQVQVQKAHQYQVTESGDSLGVYSGKQKFYVPEVDGYEPKKQHDSLVKNQELLNLFSSYNQHQPLLESSYTLPLTQQPQLHVFSQQNTPVPYQTLVAQAQPALFQPETGFATPHQNYKPNFQPEYQTFNYEEPAKQADQSVASSSDYSDSLSSNEQGKNSAEAVAQSQYVQRFFDTRTEDVNNNVEPDARTSGQNFDSDNDNEEVVSGTYYTVLPNQQTAETLASLQESGKKNSKVSKDVQNQSIQISPPVPMTIYVPDEYEDVEHSSQDKRFGVKSSGEPGEQSKKDLEQEAVKTENARSKKRGVFGSRSKPKSN